MMKKLLHIRLFTLFCMVALLAVPACVKEIGEESQKAAGSKYGLSVEEARLFFEGFVTEFHVLNSNAPNARSIQSDCIAPRWDKGKSFVFENTPIVEVPLTTPYLGTYKLEERGQVLEDHEIYKNTAIFLRARLNKLQEIEYHTVRIVADVEWLIAKGNRLSTMSLGNLEGFSGTIVYSHTDGAFHEGYKYRNGKKIARIFTSKEEADAVTHFSRAVIMEICEFNVHLEHWCFPVTIKDGEDEYEEEMCVLVSAEVDYWFCYDVVIRDDDDTNDEDLCPDCGAPGCGGSCENNENPPIQGNENPLGKEYLATQNDKFAKPNIPHKMGANQAQISATCMFSSMSYISTILGEDLPQGQYYLSYLQMTNSMNFDGVKPEHFDAFVEKHFHVMPCEVNYPNIYAAIDAGNVLLAVMNGDSGHAVYSWISSRRANHFYGSSFRRFKGE